MRITVVGAVLTVAVVILAAIVIAHFLNSATLKIDPNKTQ